MRFHSGLLGFGLCAWQLCAQEQAHRPEAPPWGVAVLMGHATGNKSYGSDAGVELTWQFLRDHWVQGRLRGSIITVRRGEGRPDGQYFTPNQAEFMVVSCDWIFSSYEGPWSLLYLGAGVNSHRSTRYEVNKTDTTTGTGLAVAWGLGWLIANQVEIELRQDLLVVDFGWDSRTTRDATCTSLVLRKRF